jgi:hypothetical protein
MITVLGFGANVVTLLLILILTITRRNGRCNRRVRVSLIFYFGFGKKKELIRPHLIFFIRKATLRSVCCM